MARKASPRITLTDAEFDVVTKIAERSKMDCWFNITERKEKVGGKFVVSDCVYDAENDRKVTLKWGIGQLHEGMTRYADYGMTKKEIKTFKTLLGKLGLEPCRVLEMPYPNGK